MATLYERPPRYCPNGHRWTVGMFLTGWDNGRQPRPCRVWICKVCDAAIYNDGQP